jgi:hypothetical protein
MEKRAARERIGGNVPAGRGRGGRPGRDAAGAEHGAIRVQRERGVRVWGGCQGREERASEGVSGDRTDCTRVVQTRRRETTPGVSWGGARPCWEWGSGANGGRRASPLGMPGWAEDWLMVQWGWGCRCTGGYRFQKGAHVYRRKFRI